MGDGGLEHLGGNLMGGGIEMLRDLGTCKVDGDVKSKVCGMFFS